MSGQDLVTVVLAAGAGSRFGGGKLLATVEGRPILSRVLAAFDGVGGDRFVVLGAESEKVRKALPAHGWGVVIATDWAAGPGASLRAGLQAAPAAQRALIMLGDLPWLRSDAVERVLLAAATMPAEYEACRAVEGERPGHPLIVLGKLLDRARNAPDAGLNPVLSTARVKHVECAGLGVAADVDLLEDLTNGSGESRPS